MLLIFLSPAANRSSEKNICKRFWCKGTDFPYECEFSSKKTYTKYELLRTCFSRILATDKETNIVQNICLTEQPLHKITTGCLWNFSFLNICMHLITNFTCKNTIFERILSRSIPHKCSGKRCFQNIGGTNMKTPTPNTA